MKKLMILVLPLFLIGCSGNSDQDNSDFTPYPENTSFSKNP